MTSVERRILIKVSTMYYLEHMKQTEIAKRLGVERTTVSKHLKRALDQGIVTITVANENFEDIESAMEKRFGLKECFIVPRSFDLLAVKQAMGRADLQLLRRIVANKQVIGLAWGTSIRELTRHAQNSKVPQIDSDFVPLDGGPENIDSELHVNTLCYELARAFGGRCHYIYAPVITRTAEIRNAIVQDANYEKISDFWQKLDIALVGIGAPVKSSNLVWMGEFGRQAIESLSRTGTVGEICSVFYDKNGCEVKTDFSVGVRKSIAANKIFACDEPAWKILCRNEDTSAFRVAAKLRRHIRANNACDVCSRHPKNFFRRQDKF